MRTHQIVSWSAGMILAAAAAIGLTITASGPAASGAGAVKAAIPVAPAAAPAVAAPANERPPGDLFPAAPAVPAVAPRPAVRRIFVPQPKGAGDTLDDSKPAEAAGQTDVVTTLVGDRILGSVVAIEADGKLHLTGDQFEGEVQVAVPALDNVVLKGGDKESGEDEVSLTNGDRVIGRLASIDAESVQVDTQAAGRLKISPKVVRSIGLSRAAGVLAESNFASGSMEPWVKRGGDWSISEGTLVCTSRGSNMNSLYIKLDQKEAVTFVAKIQTYQGNPVQCNLVLFCDTNEGGPNEGRYGRNSLFGVFYGSEYYLHYVQNGSTNSIVNRSLGRQLTQGTLRLAYDPATGKARLWIDSNDLGTYDVPTKPASGQYVMFNSVYPLKVEYLGVYRGVVAPSGEDDSAGVGSVAAEDVPVIQFVNRDRVSATALSLADGEMSFTTSYGQMKCPARTVARIVFGKKGQEEPRRQNGDVRVRSAAGRMTFQFGRLTADALIGKSDTLGEITVRRSAVREIKFNLYR